MNPSKRYQNPHATEKCEGCALMNIEINIENNPDNLPCTFCCRSKEQNIQKELFKDKWRERNG